MSSSKSKNHNIWIRKGISGGLSATISTICLQPLDVIKTQMQQQSQSSVTNTYSNTIRQLLKQKQPSLFWKGLSPSLFRVIPGATLYFLSLDYYSRLFQRINESEKPSNTDNLFIAACSRTTVVFTPFTFLKTRFESTADCYKYKSVFSSVKHIIKNEGFVNLYSGLFATLLRDVPFSSIYFVIYQRFKKYYSKFDNTNSYHHFISGLSAGVLSTFITQPFDFIKTRIILNQSFVPSRYSTFFSGFFIRVLRRSVIAATTWTLYEKLSK